MTVDPSIEACVTMGFGVFSVKRGHSPLRGLATDFTIWGFGNQSRGNRKYQSGRGVIAIAFLCVCIFILRKKTE